MLDNLFDRSSYLYEEPANLLKQELREPAIYNAIIKAIAEGASRLNDITMKVKSEDEGTYDIVQPSDYMVESMIAQGMLEKLDQDALTNLSNIGSQYLDPTYDPGNVYSVPYQGGVAAIAVNTDKVSTDIRDMQISVILH